MATFVDVVFVVVVACAASGAGGVVVAAASDIFLFVLDVIGFCLKGDRQILLLFLSDSLSSVSLFSLSSFPLSLSLSLDRYIYVYILYILLYIVRACIMSTFTTREIQFCAKSSQ